MALVLDLMAATGEPLSSLVAALPRYAMVKDQYPRPVGPSGTPSNPAELFDRIAATYPEAQVDRRDGLRLDWDDRWVHVRASNTEPIVRVIAEARDPRRPAPWPTRSGKSWPTEGGPLEASPWPTFDQAPAVAFLDVDGTLLAETTTYLFARILRRRGLIRRSFFLRALYHGFQHKPGPARLRAPGQLRLAKHRQHPGRRAGTDRLRELRRVRPPPALRRGGRPPERPPDAGDGGGPGLVVPPDRPGTALDLPRLHRHPDDAGPDRARALGRNRRGPTMLRRGEAALRAGMGPSPADRDGRRDGLRG